MDFWFLPLVIINHLLIGFFLQYREMVSPQFLRAGRASLVRTSKLRA